MITSTHYRCLPEFLESDLPIRLHETSSAIGLLKRVTVGAVITIALIAPPAVVYASFQLGEANFASLGDTTFRFTAIFVSFAIMASLFGWNLLARLLRRAGRRRIITISETQVTVREKTLFGSREWCEPLAGYCGVERRAAETVGGRQQKLVLSHPEPGRQVPVWIGEQVPDTLITGYQSILERSSQADPVQ